MKKIVLTAMIIAATVGQALASGVGAVGIYEDQTGLDCEITDAGPVKTIYIVHTNTDGAQASQWKLIWDAGMTMTYLSGAAISPFLMIGDVINGASIAYLECKTGTFPVASVNFFAAGTSAPCSYFHLAPDASSGTPVWGVVDCSFSLFDFFPGPGEAIVNANGTCPCDVGTHQATWGNIKALYR